MRIACLADIHGNLPAFEAAIEHAQRQRPNRIVIVGDIVNGSPDSYACWQLAKRLGFPILRGNHERYLAHFHAPDAPPVWHTEQFYPVRWAHQQFSPAEIEELAQLPLELRLPDLPDLLFVHASLRSDRDNFDACTPEAEIPAMYPGLTAQIVVRAHNHLPAMRVWGRHTFVTTGSVGLPLGLVTQAQYLLLERRSAGWHIAHQSIPYDLALAIRRFHESGYLEQCGPMAYLYMREVATASGHIIPFLRAYQQCLGEAVPLRDALHQFFQVS